VYFFNNQNTSQMYNLLFNLSNLSSDIPFTRKLSYSQFCNSNRKKNLQSYILKLLELYPDGLSCREISGIADVWVQSLTSPLRSLQDDGFIEVVSYRQSTVSKRVVQIYTLPKSTT